MFTVFRRLLVCLLWLWLPLSQAADSGWLRAADNQHASVRLRAQPDKMAIPACCWMSPLKKGGKPTGARREKGALPLPFSGINRLMPPGAGLRPSVSTLLASPRRVITAT